MSDERLRILLVDDDEDQYVLIRDLLADIDTQDYTLTWASTYDNGLRAVSESAPDVCLLDFRLGARTGLEILRAAVAAGCDTPMIMLTGTGDRATDVEAMKSGAADYIEKDAITGPLLERAIRYALERARARKMLIEEDEYLRTMLASIRSGVVLVDPDDFSIVDANAHALEVFGASRDDVVGRSCRDLMCGSDGHPCPIGQPQATVSCVDCVVTASDGRQVPVLKSAVPISRKGRRLILESFVDVSERKEAEEALRKTEEQLRQSQKMEAIGQLAGGVAHDFNNLLTAITGYAELVMKSFGEGDPAREDVQEIKKAAKRAASLTEQLLAFSRRQILKPRVVNMNTLVGDMEKMLRRVIGEDIQLSVDLGGDVGSVMTDPAQLEQVIVNLAVNSRDAMPRGGSLTVSTSLTVLDEPSAEGVEAGEYVELAVSDTGCGMDEVTKSRLFEPFFTTKEVGKGTGLGLATVYGIVKQSRGHVVVESEVGEGTTFRVLLPRLSEDVAEAESKPKSSEAEGGSETVLLVEDEEVLRNLGRRVLELGGYTVLVARDGVEGLRVCERHEGPIHLLVTDVVMPRMGGRQLAERVAALCPAVKVLYVSGYTDDVVVRNGVSESKVAFLQKPYSPSALLRQVRRTIDAAEALVT
jgi:PAS domain S-box-containing protein